MIKRPIFVVAMVFAMAAALVYFFFPRLIYTRIDYDDYEKISFSGTLYRTERKSSGVNLYLEKVDIAQEEGHNEYYGINKAVIYVDESRYPEAGLKIGNVLSGTCTFRQFRNARNYGNFDEEEYYRSLGIAFRAEAESVNIINDRVYVLHQFLNELGDNMTKAIYGSVDDDEIAGILNAICTGDKSGLTEESKRTYRQSGIIHILAISGLHISLIGMTVFRLLRRKLRFVYSAAVSMFLMICFCIISKASPSAMRAAIMFAVQLGAIGLGKSYDIICALSLAAILILAGEPSYIANSGFQLSFLAIVSVGIVSRTVNEFTEQKNRIISGLVVSFSIFMVSLPITASMYCEMSLYSVLLNLIVIPVMSVVLGAGMLTAICGMINFLIGRFFSGAGVYIVRLIELLCSINRKLPWSNIITGKPGTLRIVIYYSVIIICIAALKIINLNRKKKRRCEGRIQKKRTAVRLLSAAAVSALLIVFLFGGNNTGDLKIVMLDVGQGDCILIKSPSGKNYLIDGGSSSVNNAAEYRISGALKALGISAIDYSIITHPDADHSNGILELIVNKENYGITVKNILIPYVPGNENYDTIINTAKECKVDTADIYAGMEINDGEVVISCLHPDKGYGNESSNAYSAVLDIRYGEFAGIFTGDVEADGEEKILKTEGDGFPHDGYDLLKVSHHGSKYSSTEAFIERISPDIAIISAGVNNSYGHPHEETLKRLKAAGAEIYCTTGSGEIIIEAKRNGKISLYEFLQ